MIIMARGSTTGPAQHRVQPTRAPRSKNWPVWLAQVRVSDRVFPDPRGRLTHTLGAPLITTKLSHAFMNQFVIITHAVFVGLTPLIPIPILDDLVKSFFYKSLIRNLASTYNLSLSPAEIAILAEDRGQGCINGCLFGAFEFVVKRLVRKVTFVLEWRRAIDLVTHTYYIGYLMDYAFQQGWYIPGNLNQATQLRAAIESARGSANTNLVKRIVQSSFNQSRRLVLNAVQELSRSLQDIAFRRSRIWLRRLLAVRLRQRAPRLARWLYKRLRPTEAESAQVAEVENAVAQKLEQESPEVSATLSSLISDLQEGLANLPKEHFDILQNRLKLSMKLG
jgi:hypothetical protein